VDCVRDAVESGFTLAEAADLLAGWSKLDEEGVEEPSEIESLPLEPGRADVVRIMNLHKAKGLEAPVVFLADPNGGFKPRVDVRIVRDGDGAMGYFRITKGEDFVTKVLAQPVGWEDHEAAEQQFLDAEQDRLLYVAATRAKRMLVVGRAKKPSKRSSAWTDLDPYLDDATELTVPATTPAPAFAPADLSPAAAARAAKAAEAAHGKARQPSWSATSVTAESKRFPRTTPGPDDDVEADDPTRSTTAETPSRRADAGIAWGSLIHGLLEHAMRHRKATRDDLRRLAVWLTVEDPQLRPLIEKALDTVEGVASAEFWKQARASEEVYEEAPFALREEANGLPTVITGVVDLVYRGADGWRIVDYKTDVDASSEELRLRYGGQLGAYVRAWRQATRSERVDVDARLVR
jgi:ATP-dependent helicase/nuclease subunit A